MLCAAALLLSAGCSGAKTPAKTPVPSEITSKLQSEIKFPEMVEITNKRLTRYYSIDTKTVKAFSVYICSSSASADEIAVFEASNKADAEKIKTAVQARINAKIAVFQNYGKPQEYSNIKNCVFETEGNYVLFAVTDDNSKAKKTMESFFN